ncbi:MAG: hypothetical protein F4011_10625 [Acidimicrobiaceae bacterium]|nr:hypothetical protein [Acidimicrobiaceae bacterium]MYL04619.1 hypothetical protein [Acidimicrobiaceae bacterium]
MSKTARILLWRVAPLAAVLSMMAAACGSDSSEPVTEPASQPAQQQETETTSPPEEPGQAETPADETPADDAPADTASEAAPATTAAPAETGTATDEPPATTVPSRIVRIGVAFPDLEAFAVLNPEFGIGDPEAQALAVVDQWIREGLLPAGIGVELVFGKYNIISDSAKLGVCTAFAQDSDVFAAVSSVSFTVGAECLATRFQIPVIDADGAPPSLYQRGAPWFFTLRADHAKHLRSYAQWAIDNGLFNNRVGMYYETRLDEGVEAMRELVAAAGLEIVSETATSGEGVGSPEDPIAVQRFIVDGVEVALPLVGGSSLAGVLGFSESQGYRPVYLSTDYGEQTADVQAKTLPAEQFDGAMAVTMKRAGEIAAGMVNEEAEVCLSNYERYSGTDIERRAPESGEFASILRTCDLLSLVLAGLHGAAADLTRENFVAALETSGDFTPAGVAPGSFGPGDHSLVDHYRAIQWDAGCPCWVAVSDFIPMAGRDS